MWTVVDSVVGVDIGANFLVDIYQQWRHHFIVDNLPVEFLYTMLNILLLIGYYHLSLYFRLFFSIRILNNCVIELCFVFLFFISLNFGMGRWKMCSESSPFCFSLIPTKVLSVDVFTGGVIPFHFPTCDPANTLRNDVQSVRLQVVQSSVHLFSAEWRWYFAVPFVHTPQR